MTTLLAFLFVLSVLILVHEFGHFMVAKWIGVRVEKFSLGFGPKLLGFRKGETEYMISAFPLGGYVKMAGEDVEEELQGEPWEFASRSILERACIVACGPVMNILLALVLMVVVFMLGIEIPEYRTLPPVVGWVEEKSPAQRAGLQVGDLILAVDDQQVETWEELLLKTAGNYDQTVGIRLERSGRLVTRYLTSDATGQGEIVGIGIYPPIPVRVGKLTPGYPAEEAGLRVGDLITAINEEEVFHWFQFAEIIHHSYNQELELTLKREHGPTKIKVTPRRDVLQGGIGLIGIQSAQKMILRKYGFRQAVPHGYKKVSEILGLTLDFLKKLMLGQVSPKSIAGPIGIAQIAGDAAQSGSSNLFYFMAFLSLQLGVLNILPVPILDGGILFFLAIEAVLKRPLSLKKREIAQQIGMSLLLLLMVFAFYNDIMRLFG